MIKNIMKNIGVKPAEVKEKPKNLLPSGINADDVSTEDLQSYMQSIQENIDSMPTEEEMKNSKIDFSLRKSQLGSKKKELEALKAILANRKRDTDPITYIPKKNDELRVMFQKEKDPEIKAAMKEALKKHASMMPSEPFAPPEDEE